MARGINLKESPDPEATRSRAIDLMFPRTSEDRHVLTSRQKTVLNMRLSFKGETPPTQNQVADDMGISIRTIQRDERNIRQALLNLP